MKDKSLILLSIVFVIFVILLNIITIKPKQVFITGNDKIIENNNIDIPENKEYEYKEDNPEIIDVDKPNKEIINTSKTETKTEVKTPEASKEDKVIENNEKQIVPVKTQEQINDEYRKNLESKYGVTIKYGEEMGDYRLREYLPTKLTDPEEIETNLKNIKTHIAYYPVGFFKEMKDYGMPLTIYLVKNIPGSGIAGIADKEFYSDIKITVCTEEFFFRVFHHEVYHYIEAYMEIVGYSNGIFNNWDDLNPVGFNYGTTNIAYSYSLLDTTKSPYFINNYGQTNDREDRATIFEDLMARAYEPTNSYVSPNKIWDKGKKISEEIDRYFSTVNSSTTERWERFINN